MTEPDALQAENDRLRAEVESYRQRELADLRAALTAARAEINRLFEIANVNAQEARRVAIQGDAMVRELQDKLNTRDRLSSPKATRNGA